MQDKSLKLYKAISKILYQTRKAKGLKYTDICYGNEIPMSTYDDIMNAKGKASFYNIARVVKGLDLSFEEFGKLLDKELGKDFTFIDL